MSRIDVVETEVFAYDELSDEAKEKAVENCADCNVDHDWHEGVYMDAESVGIQIEEFDTYRGTITATAKEWTDEIAKRITANHGESCDTYTLATEYLKAYEALETDEDDCFLDDEAETELRQEFFHALGKEYLSLLCQEYDYLTSEEAIVETIKANELEFTVDGNLYR